MNNIMLDIRVLGKSPDSPVFAIECVFSNHQRGRLARNITVQLISEPWAVFTLKRFYSS